MEQSILLSCFSISGHSIAFNVAYFNPITQEEVSWYILFAHDVGLFCESNLQLV